MEATYRIKLEKQPFLQLEWRLENEEDEVGDFTCEVCLQSPDDDDVLYACQNDQAERNVMFEFFPTGIPMIVNITCSSQDLESDETLFDLIIPSNLMR